MANTAASNTENFIPFAILTTRLVLVPTPVAVSSKSYRALYARLHADPEFCRIAFANHFQPQSWDDEETLNVITTRDIKRSWERRGMGDFAVGIRTRDMEGHQSHASLEYLLMHESVSRLDLDAVEWIGYTGIRDATTTSLPPREPGDSPLPAWQDMIEVRYGISSQFWGKGFAKEATGAIIAWATVEKGAKRFIAETESGNSQSGRVLLKLGFTHSHTHFWKEPSEIEWAMTPCKTHDYS